MSAWEEIMVEALSRLTAPTDFIGTSGRGTRRSHLTAIDKDDAPAGNLRSGEDHPSKASKCAREGDIIVSIFVRDDDGESAADPYISELYSRFSAAWPAGVSVSPGPIIRDTEVADGDATRVDCHFPVCYSVGERWSLERAV